MKITKNQLKRMIREELDSQLLDDDNDGYSYASSSDEQYAHKLFDDKKVKGILHLYKQNRLCKYFDRKRRLRKE